MNNSFCGKFMESVRKNRNTKLVKKRKKLFGI